MRKIFQYIMLAVITIVMASCTSDIEETTTTTGKSNVQLVVGEFPAFGDSQTRAIGTPDPGKTSWAEGDELLLEMTSKTLGTKYATFTYNGKKWELTNGELAYKEDEYPIFPHVYYAPNYKWDSGKLTLKEGKVAGTDEYIEGTAQITSNGKGINVSFSNATRNYSRLRIATIENEPITVITEYLTPVAGSMEDTKEYSLTSDNDGNVFLYGSFVKNSTVTVKYNGTSLANYTFTEASENGKSYALDATVISENSVDDIGVAIAKKIAEGKTNVNLVLTSEAGQNVFENIQYGLQEAGYSTINLTVMGCKKIPSSAFMNLQGLKSIVLPDVEEIEEYAFFNCSWLQKVVLGNLKKVYGNVGKNGIFEGCTTKGIDLILAEEQKIMVEGKYYWVQGNEDYINSVDHKSLEFLGYDFKSIKCGY